MCGQGQHVCSECVNGECVTMGVVKGLCRCGQIHEWVWSICEWVWSGTARLNIASYNTSYSDACSVIS